MQRFAVDPALVLDTMVATDPQYREQVLILIGVTVANARHNDPAAYAGYVVALDHLAGLDLDEESARMLGFVNANIDHWYGH